MKRAKYIKVDGDNKIALLTILNKSPSLFGVYQENGKIIFKGMSNISEHEKWLFEAENKKI